MRKNNEKFSGYATADGPGSGDCKNAENGGDEGVDSRACEQVLGALQPEDSSTKFFTL